MTAPQPAPYRLPSRTPLNVALALIIVGFVVSAFAYCAGTKHGRTSATVAQIRAHRDTVMDTVRVVEQRLRVDTVRVRVTAQAATHAREAFDSAAQTAITAAATSPVIADSLALPPIHLCQQALAADTIAYAAVVANLADMTEDRDAQRQRAEDDERVIKAMKPPRFGIGTGIVIGAAIVATLVHFVR